MSFPRIALIVIVGFAISLAEVRAAEVCAKDHHAAFAQTRDFILAHSATVVQDDSGIPLKYFDTDEWRLYPFGDYRTPINPFKAYVQPDVLALFRSVHPNLLDFGFGYHPHEANLLIAVRNSTLHNVKQKDIRE